MKTPPPDEGDSPVHEKPSSSSSSNNSSIPYDHPTDPTSSSTQDLPGKNDVDQFKLLGHVEQLLKHIKHQKSDPLPNNPVTDSSSGDLGLQSTCDGMVLVASLLCSSLRNVKLPHLRRGAILLLQKCSSYVDDEDRLQRVVPYVISMLTDPAAIVRCSALDALCRVVSLVRHFPPSDAKIFPEYIFPMLSTLPDDPEESVRICHAAAVSDLALAAFRFLTRPPHVPEREKQLSRLRKSVAGVVQELVMGPRHTPDVRRALLGGIGKLCCFFGKRHSDDFLLPILPAFLNDRDPQLRTVFFARIVYVCFFVGNLSVEEYLLPYIDQALDGSLEPVIVNALDCLSILCRNGFIRKRVLLSLVGRAFSLLLSPSRWVRRSAVAFVAASSSSLGPVDSYVFLYPVLEPFTRRRPASLLSESAVLSCLKPSVSKPGFRNPVSSDPTVGSNMLVLKKEKQVRDCDEDRRAGTNEPFFSDKLQFSCFVSPQMTGPGGDSSPSGIPLYSFGIDKPEPGYDPTQRLKQGPGQHYRLVSDPETEETDRFSRYGLSRGDMAEVSSEDSFDRDSVQGLSLGTDSAWRPRGVLVAHLQEHRSAVNSISVSTDHGFFVSASDDSSVRVWDSRRLERDISFRSRLMYSVSGSRPLCSVVLPGSARVVIGSLDGSLHLFSVDSAGRGAGGLSEKLSGISNVRKRYGGGGSAVTSLATKRSHSGEGGWGRSVMYSTKNHGIHLWDTRAGSDAWSVKVDAEDGYMSALVVDGDGDWFVSGSSRGVLTLWDLRFLIPVNTWRYSAAHHPIEKLCLFVLRNGSSSTMERPMVYVAAGCNEVSLWNAENWSCHQVLKMDGGGDGAGPSDRSYTTERLLNKLSQRSGLDQNMKAAKYRVSEVGECPRVSGVRALLPLPGGDLLTAGTDFKIRRWDYHSPERSYCVCGPSVKEGAGNDDFYKAKSNYGVQVVQEVKRVGPTIKLSTGGASVDSAGCHRDSILALASLDLSQPLLISSSRDGAIKVWK